MYHDCGYAPALFNMNGRNSNYLDPCFASVVRYDALMCRYLTALTTQCVLQVVGLYAELALSVEQLTAEGVGH